MTTPSPKTVTKRRINGIVVSDAMNKTRVVSVERVKKHARYQKWYKVNTRFHAHDEENQYHVGDVVIMEECRPLSAKKRWMIVAKIASGHVPTKGTDTEDERLTEEKSEVSGETSLTE